jgi:Tol biopolymer transport system component
VTAAPPAVLPRPDLGPVPPPRRSPRRGCVIALVIVGVLAVLFVVALIALVLWLRALDTPATVPPDFRPPSTLPESPPGAEVPPGHIAFDSDRSGNFELYVMDGDGGSVRPLTTDATYDSWWPRISPDRRTILFYRTPKGTHDKDFAATSLWSIAADGSALTELRPAGLDGWTFQGHAEWAPDGQSLVMFGGSRGSPQIFVTDREGQNPRQVTDRPGSNLDPVFSPDGSTIAFVGCPEGFCTFNDYEIYTIPVAGGEATRLTDDDQRDHDPYYSPDGTQLAWLAQVTGGLVGSWDVLVAGADGSNPRRLANDAGITSRPQWTADGTRIVVHRIPPGGKAFGVFEFQVDGSDERELTADQPGNNEYPST